MSVFLNLLIYQGASFSKTVTFEEGTDISTWSANMQIRPHPLSDSVIMSLTDANSRILLDSSGDLTISIEEADTDLLDFDTGVFDLFLDDNAGTVYNAYHGRVKLKKKITS